MNFIGLASKKWKQITNQLTGNFQIAKLCKYAYDEKVILHNSIKYNYNVTLPDFSSARC